MLASNLVSSVAALRSSNAAWHSSVQTNGFGFLYSESAPDVQPVVKKVETPYLKKISDVDQSFAALTADKVLYLSTSSQGTDAGGTIGLGGLFNGSSFAPFGSIRGGKENSTSTSNHPPHFCSSE